MVNSYSLGLILNFSILMILTATSCPVFSLRALQTLPNSPSPTTVSKTQFSIFLPIDSRQLSIQNFTYKMANISSTGPFDFITFITKPIIHSALQTILFRQYIFIMKQKRQQLNLDYKLQPPKDVSSLQAVEPISSFEHSQTPVWTSLLHAQNNRGSQPQQHQGKQLNIMDKLKQLDSFDLANSNYSKIRLPQSHAYSISNQKYQTHYDFTNSRGKSNKENDYSQVQRLSMREQSIKKQQTTAMRTESRTQNSLLNSNLSYKHKRTGTIVKNMKNQQKKSESKMMKEKRFKQITVHEHLYLQGKRQQTKRIMERVLDQEYKKQNVLTFTPHISQKSQVLAVAKFARMEARYQLQQDLLSEAQTVKNNKQQNGSIGREEAHFQREQQKFKILNKLFYTLSQNRQIITKETVKSIIEELPLACIKLIENILTKLFQGKQLTWLQFLSLVNDKKTVANREALIKVGQKWMMRLQKRPKQEHETKDQTHPNL